MKINRELPAVSAVNPQSRSQAQWQGEPASQKQRATGGRPAPAREFRKSGSFNIQLNQQLSSMQSAERYLSDLESQLSHLKLSLGRELSAAQKGDADNVSRSLQKVRTLLEERVQRSGNSLDASFKLHLSGLVRSRFSLEGLESIEAIRQSGKETLLFSGGRQLPEPVAVILDDDLSDRQILRRFNTTLGQAGLRAELDQAGGLKFSARESDWLALRDQLAVQGEGKLFAQEGFTRLQSTEEELLSLPAGIQLDSQLELRRVLDSVVAALDKIIALREQIADRQAAIKDFILRQASQDEKQWAQDYASAVFNVIKQNPSSYAAVTQMVLAQSNISRFAVVSLLS